MRTNSVLSVVFFTLAIISALAAAYRLIGGDRLNVIVLTVESARARDLTRETAPNLFRAAQGAYVFEGHRAVSAWTIPNIISLLSGISPFDQGVHTRGNEIPGEWTMALERLAGEGWEVSGLQAFMAINGFKNLGLSISPGEDMVAWLAARAEREKPFFLWRHYTDTHLPYAPTQEYRPDLKGLLAPGDAAARGRMEKLMSLPVIPAGSVAFEAKDQTFVKALYRGGIREFDAWFGEFWRFFNKSGLNRDTVLVLSADHGEELLERGNVGHASTNHDGHLYEEVVRIPLMIWVPERAGAGGPAAPDTKAMSSHLDVMPTIAGLLGVSLTPSLEGRDLLGGSKASTWMGLSSRAGFQEADPGSIDDYVAAMVEGRWKIHLRIHEGEVSERRLYDLAADPGEQTDLWQSNQAVSAPMEKTLIEAVHAMRLPYSGPDTGPGDGNLKAPIWIYPSKSREFSFHDAMKRIVLEWSGDKLTPYILQYEAGEGWLSLSGEMDVIGATLDFGKVSRRYWDSFIRPYGKVRIRVGVKGRDDLWSDWLELKVK